MIDDGSNDNSLHYCDELSNKYPNIIVISIQHGGVGNARNYGLHVSKGKYITFCDQDDIVTTSYSVFLTKIDESDSDLLIANYAIRRDESIHYTDMIKNDCIISERMVNEMIKRLFNIPDIIGESFYSSIPRFYPTVWNCIFRSETIKNNNIDISSIVEYDDDWKLLVDVMSVSRCVYLCKDYYYLWIHRHGSQSHSSKYIPELTRLRNDLRTYSSMKMRSLYFEQSEQESVLTFFDKETLCKCSLNYCNLPYKEFKDKINPLLSGLSLNNKKAILSHCSFKEMILIVLLFIHCQWLVWFNLRRH